MNTTHLLQTSIMWFRPIRIKSQNLTHCWRACPYAFFQYSPTRVNSLLTFPPFLIRHRPLKRAKSSHRQEESITKLAAILDYSAPIMCQWCPREPQRSNLTDSTGPGRCFKGSCVVSSKLITSISAESSSRLSLWHTCCRYYHHGSWSSFVRKEWKWKNRWVCYMKFKFSWSAALLRA